MKTSGSIRRGQRDRGTLALAVGGTAVILLVAALFLWLETPSRQAISAEDRIGGPFSLIDDHGRQVTDRSFPGRYLLVYFGYASCRDVCPATLNTLAASLGRLGRTADLVQPLFITIDAAHDTPAVLRHYVSEFSPKLVGLSGTEAELDEVAKEYRVVRIGHPGAGDRADIKLNHSSVLYLIAPDGKFIAPIPADSSEMVMAQLIARYVS